MPSPAAPVAADDFPALLRRAEAHLSAAAPRLAPVVAGVGPCSLSRDPDVFRVLVRAMISQLISVAAARSITTRLVAAVNGRLTPARVLALSDDALKGCGISGQKARAIRGAAEHFRATRGFATRVAGADDLGVRGLLLPLRGVGPWTVDMVLMFGLGRLDILPVGDLGLRAGVRDLYGLDSLPDTKQLEAVAEPWRPYRTVGTWYLWRSRGWAGTWNA